MAVGAFTLVNSGLLGHLDGSIDPAGSTFYAVLTTDASGAPNLATDIQYSNISAGEPADVDYDQVAVPLSVTEAAAGVVEVDQTAEADFGAAVTISARYYWVLQGTAATPQTTDRILGFMDLNDGGTGDVSSVASDFKVRANDNGLYRVTVAP